MKHPIDPTPGRVSPRPATDTPQIRSNDFPGKAIDHPVLSRLVEEVRNEAVVESAYDRVHNRHNRGR